MVPLVFLATMASLVSLVSIVPLVRKGSLEKWESSTVEKLGFYSLVPFLGANVIILVPMVAFNG